MTFRFLVFFSFAGATATFFACGKDVDIGGSADAGAATDAVVDAEGDAAVDDTPHEICEPCEKNDECGKSGICGVLDGGNSYCVAACGAGGACAPPTTCENVTSDAGDRPKACVPEGGSCAPSAPPPPTADGATVERCGELVGPSVAADCRSCNPSSSDCQANGCYGGWWCQTYYRRCERPPKSC